MEIKTTYVAEDGTEFDTEKECYEYEHRYDDIIECGVVFFDSGHKRLNNTSSNLIDNAEKCFGMYIPNEKCAKKVHELFNEIGCESPWSNYSEEFDIGYFIYSNYWVAIDKELKTLNDLRNSLISHAL